MSRTFLDLYFKESSQLAMQIDTGLLDRMIQRLAALREDGGRLFLIGVGGSAANASHAVNDFRKIVGIDALTPVDNISELTARTNDEGWDTVFSAWLKVSHACERDVLFVLSVGGGNRKQGISVNIVEAIDEAKRRGMAVMGIVGRDGGYTKERGDHVLVIPTVNHKYVTPLTEAFQAVVWHAMVTDPRLMVCPNKWETTLSTLDESRFKGGYEND